MDFGLERKWDEASTLLKMPSRVGTACGVLLPENVGNSDGDGWNSLVSNREAFIVPAAYHASRLKG